MILRKSAALLLVACCAVPQAQASFARVSGAGLYGYISDESTDMDLNPAYAADIQGGRLFSDLRASGTRSSSLSTSISAHSRQVSYSFSLEGVRSFGPNVVALRALPSGANNKSSFTTLPSGPTSSSSYRYRTSEDWRVLWARPLGGGQAGVALSRQLVAFENNDSFSGVLGSHRANHGLDVGWFSGPRGASRLGLSASLDDADLSGHDSANPGPITGRVTDGALRAAWESPVRSARLRVLADAGRTRVLSDYTDTSGLDTATDRTVYYRLGAGLEGPDGPGFRWTLAAEGNYNLLRTLKDRVVLADVATFNRSLDVTGVVGLEKDLSAHWTVRGRANVFSVAQSRSRDASGNITAGRYMQGPFTLFAGGVSWVPSRDLSFDLLFDAITYNSRSNTRTAFNDGSSRSASITAGAAYRFGLADALVPASGM